jgi:2-dehydropantoate 2-reductase
MHILIVGAGSTGGYFGGRLAQAGRDVTFLVRTARMAQLRANGLEIVSPLGNATLAPRMITVDEIAGPFDVAILAVKAFSLAAALADLAPAVGPETMVIPVLNGMRHVEAITARFGARALVGGVCRIMATIDAHGRIVQLTPMHDLIYGEMDGARSDRVIRLDALMQGCGFDARLSDEVEREMWEKWILLAAMGGITCLMRGTIGEVEAATGGAEFARHFLDEVVHVVRTVGRAPSDKFLAVATQQMTAKGSAAASSMYRDLVQGNRIEADQIIGDLLRRAGEAGLATPLLAAAYAHLSVYQNRIPRS